MTSWLKIRRFEDNITHYRIGGLRLVTYGDRAWTLTLGSLVLSWKGRF